MSHRNNRSTRRGIEKPWVSLLLSLASHPHSCFSGFHWKSGCSFLFLSLTAKQLQPALTQLIRWCSHFCEKLLGFLHQIKSFVNNFGCVCFAWLCGFVTYLSCVCLKCGTKRAHAVCSNSEEVAPLSKAARSENFNLFCPSFPPRLPLLSAPSFSTPALSIPISQGGSSRAFVAASSSNYNTASSSSSSASSSAFSTHQFVHCPRSTSFSWSSWTIRSIICSHRCRLTGGNASTRKWLDSLRRIASETFGGSSRRPSSAPLFSNPVPLSPSLYDHVAGQRRTSFLRFSLDFFCSSQQPFLYLHHL